MTTVTVDPDGTIRDIDGPLEDSRALVIREPDRLAAVPTPEAMIALAARMATALADVVEKRHLYAVISGRKFPQVEAWMTIGRMDNVVAREVSVDRHEDGSYEAAVELVRLTDGMVIGRASALCGTPDDKPWATRGEPQRRSMAVTRAVSRAFRMQYAWIMTLAGYEPTPADEMPVEPDAPRPVSGPRPAPAASVSDPLPRPGPATVTGTVGVGKTAPVDCLLRQSPDGPYIGFRVFDEARHRTQVIAKGALADDLWDTIGHDAAKLHGQQVTVEGMREWDEFTDKDRSTIRYSRIIAGRIVGPGWMLNERPPDGPEILPGEAATHFTFPDGTVGPGKWDPKTGQVESAIEDAANEAYHDAVDAELDAIAEGLP